MCLQHFSKNSMKFAGNYPSLMCDVCIKPCLNALTFLAVLPHFFPVNHAEILKENNWIQEKWTVLQNRGLPIKNTKLIPDFFIVHVSVAHKMVAVLNPTTSYMRALLCPEEATGGLSYHHCIYICSVLSKCMGKICYELEVIVDRCTQWVPSLKKKLRN